MSTTLKALFEDQAHGLDLLRQSILAGHLRPMLALPTGGGKTVIAAHIVAGARQKHNRVAFCVPTLSLIEQTFDRFVENGLDPADMGIMQADHPLRRPHAPIQIATAQTLGRRTLPEVDVVVIDEAHIRFKVYDDWMGQRGVSSFLAGHSDSGRLLLTDGRTVRVPKLFIGLSATPWTRGLGKVYDDLIRPVSIADLIGKGRLSPFRVFAPSKPDLRGIQMVAGDYHEGELASRMNQPKLVGDIIKSWLDRGRGRPTLCFATGCDHARNLHARFEEAGVRAAYVDADTPREERSEIGRKLASGEIEVVCNIGTLTTGIDWDVRCLILARPTKSEMLFVQIIGRGLRVAPDKDHCLILDHSDNHARLGMVTDIDHDELDDGKPKAKGKSKSEPPLPRECPECSCLIPSHLHECENCGYVRPKPTFSEQSGSLAEFNGRELVDNEVVAARRAGGETVSAALIRFGPEECFKQIKFIQEERGRQSGWAAHAFKGLFEKWPPKRYSDLPASEACGLMRNWIKSRDIAWARRKSTTEAAL